MSIPFSHNFRLYEHPIEGLVEECCVQEPWRWGRLTIYGSFEDAWERFRKVGLQGAVLFVGLGDRTYEFTLNSHRWIGLSRSCACRVTMVQASFGAGWKREVEVVENGQLVRKRAEEEDEEYYEVGPPLPFEREQRLSDAEVVRLVEAAGGRMPSHELFAGSPRSCIVLPADLNTFHSKGFVATWDTGICVLP